MAMPVTSDSTFTVTITDYQRVMWSGSYKEFQRANLESLSVAEFTALWSDGVIEVGGGAAPAMMIWLLRQGAPAPDCRPINA